jgi:hypothetical protein
LISSIPASSSDGEEPVFRELVQRDEVVALRRRRVRLRGDEVAGIVVYVVLLDHRLLGAGLGLDGGLVVPLGNLRVDEQGRVRVPPPVVGGVERSHPDPGLPDDGLLRVVDLGDRVDVDDRTARIELAGGDGVVPVGRHADPVRALRRRNVVDDRVVADRVEQLP